MLFKIKIQFKINVKVVLISAKPVIKIKVLYKFYRANAMFVVNAEITAFNIANANCVRNQTPALISWNYIEKNKFYKYI